ncbi:hypothetical protein Micbo1qcDRAFT_222318 [Microdochium bolleyi]|uniref:Major facilitator superfamily domain-containing protein n=1 Tax=Microdochium bolleyi TaxID=196109 RepID=A0A136J609_9PEZI|nr:hypothetical protein Micbo1qcDRAFT_222318 [Microdochium bolleyi]
MGAFGFFIDAWNQFDAGERRNIAYYILGIMSYKFGLEAFNGSIQALITNKYDLDAKLSNSPSTTFQNLNLAVGLNYTFQCIGSILIAPLIQRFATKNVLAFSILTFGLFSAILLVVDAATGGTFPPPEFRPPNKHPTTAESYSYYGDFRTDGLIPVYCVTGIAYGMVELIRRVIPRDIVGGNVQKLRKMDSLVHIFYEVAGTTGSFCTALSLIPQFGANRAFLITPVCFSLAALAWFMIGTLGFRPQHGTALAKQPSYVKLLVGGFYYFSQSVWTGGKIIFTSRKFLWLLPGYAIALYTHRFLENGIAPIIARRYFGEAAWAQLLVGGSNLGELLGAATVFMLTNLVHTPMPWLRLDAVMLLIVWYLPYWRPARNNIGEAWKAAASFIPISFGWAAGDVSLAAYIQASLARVETHQSYEVSPLGAVMAFLYVTYVVLYAVTAPLLGRYADAVFNRSGAAAEVNEALIYIGGVQFTLIAALMIAGTFIPRGSWALNPEMLDGERLDMDLFAEEIGSMYFAGGVGITSGGGGMPSPDGDAQHRRDTRGSEFSGGGGDYHKRYHEHMYGEPSKTSRHSGRGGSGGGGGGGGGGTRGELSMHETFNREWPPKRVDSWEEGGPGGKGSW